MSTTLESRATEGLEHLGLTVARAHLDGAAQRAAAEGWTYTYFLGYLLDGELAERHRKRVELNLQFARFPAVKRLDQFDFAAQPGLDRRVIDELATGRFLGEGRNVLLLGPPGVGKTHLAIGLGVRTAELGHRVYFTTAMDLAVKLTKAVDGNRLHRELKALAQPRLLVIDEVGYLTLDGVQASLVFQVICQRYQKGKRPVSTIFRGRLRWWVSFPQETCRWPAATPVTPSWSAAGAT
jgi:DNA replication protein DnaC